MDAADDTRPDGYHLDMLAAGMLLELFEGEKQIDLPVIKQALAVLSHRGYDDQDVADKIRERIQRKLES